MFCNNCGADIPDNVKYCPSCGAQQAAPYSTYSQPGYQSSHYTQTLPPVRFVDAVKSFFNHYADFSGRSRRSEYWYVVLFNIIVAAVLGMLLSISDGFAILSTLWSIGTIVPGLALCVRRLHDVGKSGAWFLWILLPIAGPIILLVQYCTDSQQGPNQYGPSPKYL